jgi:hypothetical protein
LSVNGTALSVIAEVRAAMFADLARSGLTPAHATKMMLQPITCEQLEDKYPTLTRMPAAGYLIPYPNLKKKATDFYRFRYLGEPVHRGFAALTEHKLQRYIQPPDTLPKLYLAPTAAWNWETVLQSAEDAILITEGEKKAAKACLEGYVTLGLGGVWSFKSKKYNIGFIESLERITWAKRRVYLVFDSDAVTNIDILRAENALARELLQRGAVVSIVRLFPITAKGKTGLDDLLTTPQGVGVLDKLVEGAEEWSASQALHEMNDEVVVLKDPGCILRLANLQRMNRDAFTRLIYADRKFYMLKGEGKSLRQEEKSAASEWLEWPYRAVLERTTYQPGRPRWTQDNEFNVWPGWGIPDELVKPGDLTLWNKLLGNVFAGTDQSNLDWFLRWLAYPLQHPGTKLFTAAVVWGLQQGTGKSLIGETMARIYGDNYTLISNAELESKFNGWADSKQFIMADEITGQDKRSVADRLKGWITRAKVRIDEKNVKPYEHPDCINYYFNSNRPDSFMLDRNDRRYFVHEVIAPRLPMNFATAYREWFQSDAVGALFHYLLKLPLEGFLPYEAAIDTEAKSEMVSNSRSEAGAWLEAALFDPDQYFLPIKRTLWTMEEIYGQFLFSHPNTKFVCHNFGRPLKEAGYKPCHRGQPVSTLWGSKRLWPVRNREALLGSLDRHDKLAKIYNAERAEEHAIVKQKSKF